MRSRLVVWTLFLLCHIIISDTIGWAFEPSTPITPPPPPSNKPTPKQTLVFRESSTGVPVHIIGTMHYNPHSIYNTKTILTHYGKTGELGGVAIELCPLRWEIYQRKQPKGSLLRGILDNEFQTAVELASRYSAADIVLADEDIEANDVRINEAFSSSVRDWLNPLGGGWNRLADDLIRGWGESVDPSLMTDENDNGEGAVEYLSSLDLFDVDLLSGAPVALVRYASAALMRKPIKVTLLFAWISLLIALLTTRVGFDDVNALSLSFLGGLVLSISMAIPLTGRVWLFALLGERNEIIADNIRLECRRIAAEDGDGNGDKVCVAVLGLAHCNGVKRVLCSRQD